jgi:cation transport ATPase
VLSAPPAWQIASDLPGRVRFRHQSLKRDDELARRVEAELSSAHGVIDWHIRPLTGSLLVHFDPTAISKPQVLHLLDRALMEPGEPPRLALHPSPVKFGLANGSVALAAAGELAMPALLPASALLLVASNFKVIRLAWRELKRREIGLPTLFTTIIFGTLASGQFLAAALMAWMVAFWRNRHRMAQFRLRRELLPFLTQQRQFARLRVNGQEVEVPTDRLGEGDHIVVEEGETIPADGRLVGSAVLVDEGLLGGVAGLTRKKPGDLVYAGSVSVEGSLEIEVLSHGHATRAAFYGRELAGAAVFLPSGLAVTPHGEEFGRRAVAPTLAAAGIGLIVGDVTTAAAILRPDYATGPGMGVSLGSLHDVATCAREGILVRDATAFRRIASADVFLLDDLPMIEQAGLKVASVLSMDGTPEADILRLSATAFHNLTDVRAAALLSACQRNKIALPAIRPSHRGAGIIFQDGARAVCLRDARGLDSPTESAHPLEVLIDGRSAGMVLFGPSGGPQAAQAIEELLRQGGLAVGLLSHRPADELEKLAASLGTSTHASGLSSEAKVELVRSLHERGHKVAYVGDCVREPQVAREAHVAISLALESEEDRSCAHVRVVRTDLGWLGPLRALSSAHVDEVRTVHGAILLPNLAVVAGAFLLGFTSLSAVVLTNLGTLAVYSGLSRRKTNARSRAHSGSTSARI